MHGEEEDEFVMLVFASLYLVQHRLCLLKQYECLFKTFLGDEVDCALIELIDNNRHLVYHDTNTGG